MKKIILPVLAGVLMASVGIAQNRVSVPAPTPGQPLTKEQEMVAREAGKATMMYHLETIKKEWNDLSPQQRQQFFRSANQHFEALTPAERVNFLQTVEREWSGLPLGARQQLIRDGLAQWNSMPAATQNQLAQEGMKYWNNLSDEERMKLFTTWQGQIPASAKR